jgi:TPR repeat protein
MLSTGQGVEHDDTRALNLYRELAKAGYLPAEQKAAAMVAEGRGDATDTTPLRLVLEKSAQAGNAGAAYELGSGLLDGRFGKPDRAAGVRWLERAAESDHPLAQFHLAWQGLAAKRRVQWLERAARLGFTPAEFSLGMAYAYGDGVSTNDRVAVDWYLRAAEKGNVEAQSSLGWRYLHGVTLPKDEAQALVWMRRAADQGNTLSMTNLVARLRARPDPASQDEALVWIKRLAESGSAQYQGVLGAFYSGELPGFGAQQRDPAEALRWLKKAAAQGNGAAEVALGNAYNDGRGVPSDVAQAIRWYERAAERGETTANINLARIYLLGRGGTPRNPEKARSHLDRAALSPLAKIRQLAQELQNPNLRWVDLQSQQYDWPRAREDAKSGDREAQRLLGEAYLKGNLGLPQSMPNAYHWFLKAAKQGDPVSMNNVGYTLYRGILGKVDLATARAWFEKAAHVGDSNSMVSLARMNELGEAGKRDPKKALNWLVKAAESNNKQAIERLVMVYRNGELGQPANPKRAAYWEARIVPSNSQDKP